MKPVIEMAREAGFTEREAHKNHGRIERLVELVRADERQVCMDALNALPYQRSTKYDCMDAIRARGNT